MWTHDVPTHAGFYWRRWWNFVDERWERSEVVEILPGTRRTPNSGIQWWSEPIHEPPQEETP